MWAVELARAEVMTLIVKPVAVEPTKILAAAPAASASAGNRITRLAVAPVTLRSMVARTPVVAEVPVVTVICPAYLLPEIATVGVVPAAAPSVIVAAGEEELYTNLLVGNSFKYELMISYNDAAPLERFANEIGRKIRESCWVVSIVRLESENRKALI